MTFDEFINHPAINGVHVGGCDQRTPGRIRRFRAKAHIHENGHACFMSAKWLDCSELLIHELAHAITGHGHDDTWRKKVLELGGTLDEVPNILKSFYKKPREVRS